MEWRPNTHMIWQKMLSDEHIKKLDFVIQNNYNGFENPNSPADGKVTTTKVISYDTLFQFKEVEYLYKTAEDKITYHFGYDIFPYTCYSNAIYNEYYAEAGGKYDWHIDCSNHPKWDMKMTLIVNLSESFTGGEFQLFSENGETPIKEFSEPGTMILFKSHIMHRVTPVTSGVRRTLTFFFGGPAFR